MTLCLCLQKSPSSSIFACGASQDWPRFREKVFRIDHDWLTHLHRHVKYRPRSDGSPDEHERSLPTMLCHYLYPTHHPEHISSVCTPFSPLQHRTLTTLRWNARSELEFGCCGCKPTNAALKHPVSTLSMAVYMKALRQHSCRLLCLQ